MLHRSKFVLLLVGLLMMLLAMPALAADNFYVYLYNDVSHDLVRVNVPGQTVETFNLEIADNAQVSGWGMGVSPDGNLVGFCSNVPSSNGQGFDSTVHVRDLAAGTNVVSVNVGTTVNCSIDKNGFSADGSQMAVGTVERMPASVEETGEGSPSWQLLLLDVTTGQTINSLNEQSPAVVDSGFAAAMPIMPEVFAVDGSTVTFAATPFGIGETAYSDVYQWDATSDALTFLYNGPRSNASLSDTLPATGETVWLDYDQNLPAAEPIIAGPVSYINVVKMLDASGQERVIYHSGDSVIGSPTFIEGGERIALMLHTPQGDPPSYDSHWVALDRNGTVTDLAADLPYADLVNAPGGTIYFMRKMNPADGSSTFILASPEAIGDYGSPTIWSADEGMWFMIGASAAPLGSNLTPFPAIN